MVSVAPAESGQGPALGVTDLSLNVWALRALHELDLTEAQLKALKTAAPAIASRPEPPANAKVPAKYLAALRSMREALVTGTDDDRIAELQDDLETMREDDEIEIDDKVTITPEARAKTPEIIRLLTATQVAGYIAAYQDEIPDPVSALLDAADEVRDTDDEEFKSIVEETADDVATMVAGLDVAKASRIAEQVRGYLKHCRPMGEGEFQKKRGELEATARQMVGEIDPFLVLRHWLERDVAELLSNPQLIPAIDVRLRQAPSGDKS